MSPVTKNRERRTKLHESYVAFGGGMGATERILALLGGSPTKPYNPATIARLTGLRPSTARTTLLRLTESGRLCKTARGTYAARDVGRLALRRQLTPTTPFLHNLVFVLPTSRTLKRENHPPPHTPHKGGALRGSSTHYTEPPLESYSHHPTRELQGSEVLRPLPGLRITLQTFPGKLMATVGASDHPLSAESFLWLLDILHRHTGRDWAEEGGIITKADVHTDLRYTFSGIQEATAQWRDLCLAIYRRGDWTRVELRALSLQLPLRQLANQLLALLEPPPPPPPPAPAAPLDADATRRTYG